MRVGAKTFDSLRKQSAGSSERLSTLIDWQLGMRRQAVKFFIRKFFFGDASICKWKPFSTWD
jgi:hypothetical protein